MMEFDAPVGTVTPPQSSEAISSRGGEWPDGTLELARELQRRLAIGDRDWHALKTQRPRRGVEQVMAGVVQLLAADEPTQPAATPARERAVTLIDHGLAWLKGDLSDPGCPSHGRRAGGRRVAS